MAQYWVLLNPLRRFFMLAIFTIITISAASKVTKFLKKVA
jgi:hypothetical protein